MVSPSDDVFVAQWLVNSLLPFDSHLAGAVVPPGFEAYACILHPAQSTSGYVSWAEIATWAGCIYHPSMQFESIATPVNGSGADSKPWDGQVPYHLPLSHADALAHILRPFTTTPEKIRYLVWDGYGSLPATSRPRVQRLHRNYLLYYGGIDDAEDLGIGEHREPPEYWFPDDKSWCVATDVGSVPSSGVN